MIIIISLILKDQNHDLVFTFKVDKYFNEIFE